jgi:hypothetical protein
MPFAAIFFHFHFVDSGETLSIGGESSRNFNSVTWEEINHETSDLAGAGGGAVRHCCFLHDKTAVIHC